MLDNKANLLSCMLDSKYTLVAASHDYILKAHMNKHTLLDNVMSTKENYKLKYS
jgi:hypothetical protein